MVKKKFLLIVLVSFFVVPSLITTAGGSCSVEDERQQLPALVSEQRERRRALEAAAMHRRADSPKQFGPHWSNSGCSWTGEASNVQRVVVAIDGHRKTVTIPLKSGETRSDQPLRGRVTNEGLGRSTVHKVTHNGENVYIDVTR